MSNESSYPIPVKRPVHSHWFATEVYNQFVPCDGDYDLQFAEEIKFNILQSNYEDSKCVHNSEPVYTWLLARAFNRYLYSNSTDGCCLHQTPLKIASKPDFFVSRLHDHVIQGPPHIGSRFQPIPQRVRTKRR